MSTPTQTNLKNNDPFTKLEAQRRINDYRNIKNKDGTAFITPDDIYEQHLADLKWLKEQLELYKDWKVIVMTHHSPTRQSIHKRFQDPSNYHLNGSFCSDYDQLIIENPHIAVWCFGHQHNNVNKFRKRFGEMFYLDYCKAPNGMMRTSMGKFKAIDMPIVVSNTESVSWIVLGDKKAISKLLKEIPTLGKKTNQGYGWVKKWTIEPTKQKGNRGFPCPKNTTPDYFGRARPSYHNPLNQEYIKIKEF